MAAEVETSNWSGEGTFTQVLVDCLKQVDGVSAVRVEDAPASRSEADYNFMSNEIFVVFERATRNEPIRRLGLFPGTRAVEYPRFTVAGLEAALAARDYPAAAPVLEWIKVNNVEDVALQALVKKLGVQDGQKFGAAATRGAL